MGKRTRALAFTGLPRNAVWPASKPSTRSQPARPRAALRTAAADSRTGRCRARRATRTRAVVQPAQQPTGVSRRPSPSTEEVPLKVRGKHGREERRSPAARRGAPARRGRWWRRRAGGGPAWWRTGAQQRWRRGAQQGRRGGGAARWGAAARAGPDMFVLFPGWGWGSGPGHVRGPGTCAPPPPRHRPPPPGPACLPTWLPSWLPSAHIGRQYSLYHLLHTVSSCGICQGMSWQHLNQPCLAGKVYYPLSLSLSLSLSICRRVFPLLLKRSCGACCDAC